MGYGYNLNNIHVTKVYDDKSPEYIVEDLITNYTTFTFASSNSSGVTIEKYIVDDYIYKVIDEMCKLLDWQFRTDIDKNSYFEPSGDIDNGVTLTTGTDVRIKKWLYEEPTFNKVKVKGDYAEYQHTQTFSGDTSTVEFSTTYKPVGNATVSIGGSTKTPGDKEGDADYYIYRENKLLVFTTAPGSGTDNISTTYSYQVPVIVETEDEDSVVTYGERHKEIDAPFIKTFADARRYANELLNVYGDGTVQATVVKPGIDTTLTQGELITLADTERSITEEVTINEIIYKYPENETELKVGSYDFIVFDWQKEVQERIKQLEKRMSNEELIMQHRLLKDNLSVSLTMEHTDKWRNIYNGTADSFILGHATNGKLGVQTGVGGGSVLLGDYRGDWVEV